MLDGRPSDQAHLQAACTTLPLSLQVLWAMQADLLHVRGPYICTAPNGSREAELSQSSLCLQIDLIGKGGPEHIDGREIEYDVRLVNVRVLGSPVLNMVHEKGCLRACARPSQSTISKMRLACLRHWTPRFDSSDSDLSDLEEARFRDILVED